MMVLCHNHTTAGVPHVSNRTLEESSINLTASAATPIKSGGRGKRGGSGGEAGGDAGCQFGAQLSPIVRRSKCTTKQFYDTTRTAKHTVRCACSTNYRRGRESYNIQRELFMLA